MRNIGFLVVTLLGFGAGCAGNVAGVASSLSGTGSSAAPGDPWALPQLAKIWTGDSEVMIGLLNEVPPLYHLAGVVLQIDGVIAYRFPQARPVNDDDFVPMASFTNVGPLRLPAGSHKVSVDTIFFDRNDSDLRLASVLHKDVTADKDVRHLWSVRLFVLAAPAYEPPTIGIDLFPSFRGNLSGPGPGADRSRKADVAPAELSPKP